ncbi:zinc finger CW-type PWWP domain protein 1-like isoform X2 [Alosa sapidissima]|uniref:zinc finger CW-type PWWP domain protein 1-like isoform X2 n=1 Tax=Alosa sapidissima TaxID=34773 RepID=UPI001C0A378F|nr:zinc finger CW-type PWWP domain protein 1-like isoform X2 [Alosa sapidissima]
MDMKIGQKEKRKFAPPSARDKQPHGKEKSEDGEDTKKEVKTHREMEEKTTTDTVEQDIVGIKKTSEKHTPLAGLNKKGTGEKNKAGNTKVITEGGQAGDRPMENSIVSQSLSDDGPEGEVTGQKDKKEKVKNKQQEPATGGDKDTNGMPSKNKHLQKTGESAQREKKEKKRRENAPVALTDSQYEDLFDNVLGAAQLETCMEDARAMLSEVELLQASIDQEVNKMREEREDDEREIYEDRTEKMHHRHKEREEKGVKSGSQKRRKEDDSEADEYDSWVQCSRVECKKWRRLQDYTDPSTLPKNWTCRENTDLARSSCDAPEESWSVSKEEEFYYCSLVPGSLVWAQQTGYPWWPAMIERDPITNDFLQFKTKKDPFPCKCHVTYLGSPASRAWVQRCRIRDYNDLQEQTALNMARQQVYKRKLRDAIKMAGRAQKLALQKRLNRFGFMTRRATDGENLEEDSDIEESSGKGNEGRKRGNSDSGNEEVGRPQKQRKQTEDRVEEPKEDVIRESEIKSETETTGEAGKTENEENKQEKCEMEEKSLIKKPRKGADRYRDTENKENEKVIGENKMKKPAKDKKEKESMKKGLEEGKKGTEKKDNQKKGANLARKKGTIVKVTFLTHEPDRCEDEKIENRVGEEQQQCPAKQSEMQTTPSKQDEEKTESKEGKVKKQQQCPVKESGDQAVPDSAVETSPDTVSGYQEEERDEEKETEREDTERMQEEVDGEEKSEGGTLVEVEESIKKLREEEKKDGEKGAKDEEVAGKEKTEERQEPEKCMVEGLGLSDDDDGVDFLDTDLDIMGCKDDLMKRLACAEEEEEEDFSTILFEE